MTNDTPPSSSSSSFDDLPTEVLRSILSYMDVPSLAVLSNSHRGIDGNVSELASDDVTWYSLVRERFGIGRDNRRLRRRRRRHGRCGVRGIGCEEDKEEEEEEEEGVVVVNKRGGGDAPPRTVPTADCCGDGPPPTAAGIGSPRTDRYRPRCAYRRRT